MSARLGEQATIRMKQRRLGLHEASDIALLASCLQEDVLCLDDLMDSKIKALIVRAC